ncbi:MAG: GxxExxY protein [Desulfuromonadales bacterium]
MILNELTEKVIKSCFEVSNELGSGFLESVYEKALLIAIRDKGLSVGNQVPLQVHFRQQVVGDFFADMIVESQVLVELKAVKALAPEHIAQVLNYLRGTNIPVGLLVNFGNPKLEIRRFENRIQKITA